MKSKITSWVLVFIFVVLTIVPFVGYEKVYADGEYSEDFTNAYKNWMGSLTGIDNFAEVITFLNNVGEGSSVTVTPEGIAGVIGNMRAEGGIHTFALEGYSGKAAVTGEKPASFKEGGTYVFNEKPTLNKYNSGGNGHGIFQWSFSRAEGLSNYASAHTEYASITVTHYLKGGSDADFKVETCKIPGINGQLAFMIDDKDGDGGNVAIFKRALEQTDAAEAGKIFGVEWERYQDKANYTGSDRERYCKEAVAVVAAFDPSLDARVSTRYNPDGSVDTSEAEALAALAVEVGFYAQEDMNTYLDLINETSFGAQLHGTQRSDFDTDSIIGLENWERNVRMGREDSGLVATLRKIVMVFGIVMIVYSVLLYVAFWFDRINNFISIDALGLLTLGRLHASLDNECTYSFREVNPETKKTVNHRIMATLCILIIFIGVLIVSGKLYVWLSYLIYRARAFFS